ncbi:MAG TPA: phospholipase D-like domain-containing protein [Aromatoleum sp.]|uniref:phospholipase D-like domain-containing protein n=1 Tax=Aromatoleum sp. TaxID=2307007 RepID=UPI002B464C22|nr:phospholipase D-like domain-containing protein [Aromatoleum sp.]HJV24671.1 phospholipase D-like domain-containing protein [Aromatoleum sp.]
MPPNVLSTLAGLHIILTGCTMGPAADLPPPGFVSTGNAVRIEDERGPLGPQRSRGVVRELEQEDSTGLVRYHLQQVEGVLAQPLAVGNDARLLIDGPQTEAAMFREIGLARERIDIETYILEAEGAGERLASLLEKARSAGVQVRVMYDSAGSLATPEAYFDRLRAAGVAVCAFNPLNPLAVQRDWRLTANNRDHRKIMIIDRRIAFTGGINISVVYSSSSFGRKRTPPDPKAGWRDTHVAVRGPVVAQFQQLFDDTWERQKCEAPPGPATPAKSASGRAAPGKVATARAGDMAMRLVVADPAVERSEPYVALMSAIENAKSRVWLTYGYFVPDERTLQLLQDAARHGVDVRLVLPGFSDFWAPFHAGRSHYTALLAAGVRIFERRDALLHAKTAVIDGVWSSVGSTNLDWRSFVHNYEADVLVVDRSFATELEKLFALDESASHEVTRAEWKRRGIGPRFLEWLARRWEYLL